MRGLNGLQGLAPRKTSGLRTVIPSIELVASGTLSTGSDVTLEDVSIGAPHPNRVIAVAFGRGVNAIYDAEAQIEIDDRIMASLQNEPAPAALRKAFAPLFFMHRPSGSIASLRFKTMQGTTIVPKFAAYRIIANDPWPIATYRDRYSVSTTIFNPASLAGEVGIYGTCVGAGYTIASLLGLTQDVFNSESVGTYSLGRINSPRDGFNITYSSGADWKSVAALTWR